MSASSFSNHLEVSEIAAIRADAERFCEDDIVRLCDFTLAILGECCGKAETCERECIYRWKARAAEAQKDAERYRFLRDRLYCADFSYGDTSECCAVFKWPRHARISANLDASIDAALSPPGEAG